MLSFASALLLGQANLHARNPLLCTTYLTKRPRNPNGSKAAHIPAHASLESPTYALSDEIRNLLRKDHIREAVALLEEEIQIEPNGELPLVDYRYLHEIIMACNETRRWELALRAFRVLELLGYAISRSTSCILFKVLLRAGRINEAEQVLKLLWEPILTLADGSTYTLDARQISHRLPDEKMVTQVANGAVDAGRPEVATKILRLMEQNGMPLTLFSTSVLIKAYGRQGHPDMIGRVLDELELAPDVIVFNSAIDAYIRCNERVSAMKLLQEMRRHGLTPNARSYNPILRHLAKAGMVDKAFSLRDQMVRKGIPQSPRTTNALIQACVCVKDWQRAREVLAHAMEAMPDPQSRVTKDVLVGYTTIISGLATEGDMQGAEELLAEMVESISRSGKAATFEVDVGIALTAILSALLDHGEFVKAWILFRSVRRRFKIRLPPDMYNAVIRGLVKRGDRVSMDAAERVFDEMMHVFRKRRKSQRARHVDGMHGDPANAAVEATPNAVARAYNSIIDGFVRLGDTTNGERYLDEMEDNGHGPTVVTYTTLINGYGKELDISSVRRVFKRMQRAGITPDRVTMNAFLGACVRCGEMDLAIRVFEDMQRVGGRVSPNLVSFSALIAGYVRAGQREQAWETYEEMKGIGIVPNERLLDRMMAAFVSPDLRPTHGEAWGDYDNHDEDVEVVEVVEEDGDEDSVIEVMEDGDEDIRPFADEMSEHEVWLEDLRKRMASEGGWASKRVMVLLADMEKCKCSEISRQRWRRALEKVWS